MLKALGAALAAVLVATPAAATNYLVSVNGGTNPGGFLTFEPIYMGVGDTLEIDIQFSEQITDFVSRPGIMYTEIGFINNGYQDISAYPKIGPWYAGYIYSGYIGATENFAHYVSLSDYNPIYEINGISYSISSVTETSSCAMMLLGFAALGFAAKRGIPRHPT